MIHSFSAADPADPGTIGGRWLTQGAFVYFGSVYEPYLQAFRKPGLVADLVVRGVPLSAALRQGESEPLGRPWRLVFLGDPLFRIPSAKPPGGANSSAVEVPAARPERFDCGAWRGLSPAYADWLAVDVEAPPENPAPGDDGLSADRRLQWCRDSAVAELAGGPRVAMAMAWGALGAAWRPGPAWRSTLMQIPRERLDPRLRPAFDELIADALSQSGEWDDLQARLSRIPPDQRRPRVWAALETGAMFRLARAARDPNPEQGRARIRGLLDEVNRSTWPPGSAFPAQFAERVAALRSAAGSAR
jgi:hypothetical protein